MQKFWKDHFKNKHTSGILGPGADKAFAPLAAPEIRQRVLIAHLVNRSRATMQQHIGLPLGRVVLRRWIQDKAESHYGGHSRSHD